MTSESDSHGYRSEQNLASAAVELKRSFEEMGSRMETLSQNMTELADTFDEIGDGAGRTQTVPVHDGSSTSSDSANIATADD